jgi:hypothetical protein
MSGDLLVLDRLGLREAWRGRGLGLAIIAEAVRQIGSGCAVIAMIPCALKYNAEQSKFVVASDDAGTKRLTRYYRRLGFRKLGNLLYFDNSQVMTLSRTDTSTVRRSPRMSRAPHRSRTGVRG